jgi:glycosyltransferase involved in cell wall biosynthesis
MPKVSVILTSYNHAEFLKQAIESVLEQTFKDFELIIWDDASADNSWEIINSYQDPRIKAYRNERNLWGGNINRALAKASGKYIAIHHSDDIWMPEKLEKQVGYLDANPGTGAVFTLAEIINDDGGIFSDEDHFYFKIFEQENRTRHQWLSRFFYKGNCLCHPSVLIRKKCYDTIGRYDERLAQLPDFDMWIRLCLKYDIHIFQEKLIQFRVLKNEANGSGRRPESNRRTRFESIKVLNNYLGINSKDEFIEIFPEANNVIPEKYLSNPDMIKFAAAQLALKAGQDTHRVFAKDALYDLISRPETAEKLEEFACFAHGDFKKLTGVSETGDRESYIRDLEAINKGQNDRISRLRYSIKKMELSLSYKAGKMLTFPLYAIREYLDRILIIIKGSSLFNKNRLSRFPEEFSFRGYLDDPDNNARCKMTRGWFVSKKPFKKVELFIGGKNIAALKRTVVRKDVDRETRGYDHIDKKGFDFIIPYPVLYDLKNKERTLFIRFYIDGKHYVDKFHTKVRL